MPTAIITGASRGLGLALAKALAERGWRLVIDAREAGTLNEAAADLPAVTAIAGDVTDPEHRQALVAAAGRVDLLVNNASVLGPSPQPHLTDYPLETLRHVYEVNVLAPLALIQLARPARIVNVTSDAAVEPYEGWGGYGSAKAALDHLTAILAVEHHDLKIYAGDPRPRPAGADRGRPAVRALPGAGPRGSARMTALQFDLPKDLEASDPPP